MAEAGESAGFAVAGFIEITAEPALMERLISRIGELDFKATALAIGVGTNFARAAIHAAVSSEFPEASFPSIVHQTAWQSPSAAIAKGVTLPAHSSVGPNASLGLGSLVNTGASLDHDGELGEITHLGELLEQPEQPSSLDLEHGLSVMEVALAAMESSAVGTTASVSHLGVID